MDNMKHSALPDSTLGNWPLQQLGSQQMLAGEFFLGRLRAIVQQGQHGARQHWQAERQVRQERQAPRHFLCTLLSHPANCYSSAHSCHTQQTVTLLHTPVTPSKLLLFCTLFSRYYSSAHSSHTITPLTPSKPLSLLDTPLTPNQPLLWTLPSHQTNLHSSAHSTNTKPLLLSTLLSHQTNHHSSPHSCHTQQTITPLRTPITPNKPLLFCTLLSHQTNLHSSAHSCHTKQTITPLHTPVTPSKPLLLCTLLSHQANPYSSAHSCHTKQTLTPLCTPLTPSQSSNWQALRHFSRTLLSHQAYHLVGITPPGTQSNALQKHVGLRAADTRLQSCVWQYAGTAGCWPEPWRCRGSPTWPCPGCCAPDHCASRRRRSPCPLPPVPEPQATNANIFVWLHSDTQSTLKWTD